MANMRRTALILITLATAGHAPAQDQGERNFFACRVGYASCRPSELTKEQLEIVEQAALARNYSACRNGQAACKPALLNADQAEAVETSRLARNFADCRFGNANCDRSLLNADQIEADQTWVQF